MTSTPPQILLPTPTDGDLPTPTIRCKKCHVPLPDAAWKNCDSCRRKRTENFHRWKQSVKARDDLNVSDTPGPSLPSEAQSSSAPAPRTDVIKKAPKRARYGTSSQASRSIAVPQLPNERDHNGPATGGSRPETTTNQPRSTSTSVVPPAPIHVPEFQWSDELVDRLTMLAPHSTFLGAFSVVADPAVNNAIRANMFADQLRARGIPISQKSKSSSRNLGSNAYALVFLCRCQEACHGRVIISVDDDVSHPYGVLGQRIGVAILHA